MGVRSPKSTPRDGMIERDRQKPIRFSVKQAA
jgi:hypothetical protein